MGNRLRARFFGLRRARQSSAWPARLTCAARSSQRNGLRLCAEKQRGCSTLPHNARGVGCLRSYSASCFVMLACGARARSRMVIISEFMLRWLAWATSARRTLIRAGRRITNFTAGWLELCGCIIFASSIFRGACNRFGYPFVAPAFAPYLASGNLTSE